MVMKLSRHDKEKRMVTIRMDEEAFQRMYYTLTYARWQKCDNLDEYAEDFYKIWNKVCGNFERDKE